MKRVPELLNSIILNNMKRNLKQSNFLDKVMKWKISGLTIISALLVLSSCSERSTPFNLVLLPDTQVYSRAYPEIFRAQTEWIVQNADSIAFVLHQGDIT